MSLIARALTRMNRLAVDGGKPVRRKPVPSWPRFDEQDAAAVAEVLRSGRLVLPVHRAAVRKVFVEAAR